MKKIIIGIFWIVFWLCFVSAQGMGNSFDPNTVVDDVQDVVDNMTWEQYEDAQNQMAKQLNAICTKKQWSFEFDFMNNKCWCTIQWEKYDCNSIPSNVWCNWSTLKNGDCCEWYPYDNDKKCCEGVVEGEKCYPCFTLLPLVLSGSTTVTKEEYAAACSDNTAACPWKAYTDAWWASKCCDWSVLNGNCIQNTYGKMWIEIDQDCLINGQCKFNIYKVLNIRKSDQDTISVKTFAQDVLLALTTFFGVLLTAIVVISWLFYVLTPLSEPLKARAKKGLLAWLSWLFLVIWSYAIVRFVQFIATGWWW